MTLCVKGSNVVHKLLLTHFDIVFSFCYTSLLRNMATIKELPTPEQAVNLLEPIKKSVIDQAMRATVNLSYEVVHPMMGIANVYL